MQPTHHPQEPAPEVEKMQGPEIVTSRVQREIPQEFFRQREVYDMNSQQDFSFTMGAQHRTPQFPRGVPQAPPEPSRTPNSSYSYPPPAPFNMGTLNAALPHERDPNAGAASQWSQSNPHYPPAPAPGGYGYGYGYGYGHQYPPSTVQHNGTPGGYEFRNPQGGFNQGASSYGGRSYYSQSAGGYH